MHNVSNRYTKIKQSKKKLKTEFLENLGKTS